METTMTPKAYRVRVPSRQFPRDFWVLAETNGNLLLETDEGTAKTTPEQVESALNLGYIVPMDPDSIWQ